MEMLNTLNVPTAFPLAELEVGKQFYWHLGNLEIHGQILLTSWFVIGVLVIASILATRKIQMVPAGTQNLMEYALEFIRNLAKTQIGERNIAPGFRLSAHCSCSFLLATGLVRSSPGN